MSKKTWATPGGKTYNLFEDALAAPHLLIAGSTGSGKSVLLNGLISTLLHRLPCNVQNGAKMILLDPKRVELAQYKNLPHTIAHASGQNPEAWRDALQIAVDEMDRRYNEMERQGLKTYNGGDLYVIIDEFASINNRTNPLRTACVSLLLRLANEGRAAKVKTILATQVPKSTVLPTEIRDNYINRFCLMTEDATQSRLIMGESGCELLPEPRIAHEALGYWKEGRTKVLYRIPFVQQEELDSLCAFWENQAKDTTRGLKRLFRRRSA